MASTFSNMRTPPDPAKVVATLLDKDDRTYMWLSRQTGIPYKKLLRQAKHGSQPLSLYNAALIADALSVEVPALISEIPEAAA